MPTADAGERYCQMSDGKAPGVEMFSRDAQIGGGPGAATTARRIVEDELNGRLPRQVVEDVALLVTELVANGVRHGGAGSDSFLRLLLRGDAPGLRVEIANPTEARSPVPTRRPADLGGGGGIGLNLVDTLASRWGVRSIPSTAVWFELDC
jgi:anti-sigma regulatory factor (Ser/Thr protein kinase)